MLLQLQQISPIIKLMFLALCRINFRYIKSFGDRMQRQAGSNYNRSHKEPRLGENHLRGTKSIDLTQLKLNYVEDTEDLHKVPELEHGLDQYLNGQLVFGDKGVGQLPKSSEKSGHELIQKLSKFVEPSEDVNLISKGVEHKCKYISSTSSISSPLIVLYYLFSCFRLPKTNNVYDGVAHKPQNWMISFRKPTTFYLMKRADNLEAIVGDKGVLPFSHEVLMELGHIVEYFLTHKKEQTEAVVRGDIDVDEVNYYRYAKVNDEFMLRSQIDCMSRDQNGKPFVFEIKSRACAPIRYDIENYKEYIDYNIDTKRGQYQSFEREYFDLIRGGFLKYLLQVKIGRMDGAFIAYHNTEKIYGYEYVKLKQMALRVMGDEYNLDVTFICISKMMSVVLDHIRTSLPQHKDDSLKIGFYAEYKTRKLCVMVEGMSVLKQYPIMKQKKPHINNIIDYFTYECPLQNPVYKFEFDFYILANGIQLNNSDVLFTPHDTIEIKYRTHPYRLVTRNEYYSFLYEAYKDEEVYGSKIYKGLWGLTDFQQE